MSAARLGAVKRSYRARSFGLALGFGMLATVLAQHHASAWAWIIGGAYCFGFPHLAWMLARRARDPMAVEHRCLLVDHVCGGLATAAMAFSLLPGVLTLSLMTMDTIAGGGWRLARRGLLCHVAGAAAGVLLLGLQWQPEPTLAIVAGCLPVMLLQPLSISLTARRAIDKLQAKQAELERQGRHDGLSGLFNRTHWESLVRIEFERSRRTGEPATLVLADLDHFKRINDEHGHAAGDEAIRGFAATLRRELRVHDVPGRYGGEEFGILLPATTAAAATGVIERLRRQLHEQRLLEGVTVTASFGAVELTAEVAGHDAWLRLADQMLYRAKHLGRDRLAVLGEIDADVPPAMPSRGAALVPHLLAGLDHSDAAMALFDPQDALVFANAAFRRLYCVQPHARSFAEIMRRCHALGIGPRIETADIDAWLRMADGKRRSQSHRRFAVDMVGGAMYRVDETSFSDGWVFVVAQRESAAAMPDRHTAPSPL